MMTTAIVIRMIAADLISFLVSMNASSPGIAVADYFEHAIGGIGRDSQPVVTACGIEGAQVQPVDEAVQGVFEGTWK
jgi:hypothetical protein